LTLQEQLTDRVRTPSLSWWNCSQVFGTPRAQCATAALPLNYRRPGGATTNVALLRIKASRPAERIGTLFLNPGGPGGSGVGIASAAPYFLSKQLLQHFDIVGFDPRGTNFSDNVRCWPNAGAQIRDLSGMNVAFPMTRGEISAYVTSAKAWGRACSTTGRPMTSSMSTAEVARDMDVLRRALGDSKLSYLGFSYGSYLGQVYANMFPHRVRAIAIDGVLNPVAWAGTARNAGIPQTMRLRSGQGATKALNEILLRCAQKGPKYCQLASLGNPIQLFHQLAAKAKKAPLVITDPEDPTFSYTVSYADMYSTLLGALYDQFSGYAFVDYYLSSLVIGTSNASAAQRSAAVQQLHQVLQQIHQSLHPNTTTAAQRKAFPGFDFPYDNSPEAFASVLCTDGLNPRFAGQWPAFANLDARSAPGFGPLWTWASAPCASSTWTVRDPNRYGGPFTRWTSNPVLVVGDYFDPATNYQGAVAASRLLPNSRLLSSNSFGHTAYGTSACVTNAMDAYLLAVALPPVGKVCVGPQPFTQPLSAVGGKARLATPVTTSGARPAPITPFVPSGIGG